ncbi:L-aspartate oxidase [Microbacterium betulae]|uniref:L-aspartate oxidase n=1 Tax=Microbacterium betulae TaxID=2981139 RepID=A0AA97FN18_9MICO|nr:L-aspartate oxidase [Microbacterium sp. AB]WOF24412.1 L-aspartate oxidase [Microbacterium sp. AB]
MTTAIVAGSGVAGLTTALHAARAGVDVALVTKGAVSDSTTRCAQGGIAAALFDDDRVEDHLADTLSAGAGLGDGPAAEVLVTEGPQRVRDLIALGVAFDRDGDGRLRRGLEAAHSSPRILHAGGDATGRAIEDALVSAVRAAGVRIVEHAFLVDLVGEDDGIGGARVLVDGGVRTLSADAVVLATGGAGQLYARTTNPLVATADGIAAALRAGAAVSDLEFVQFHPTVLAAGAPFLVSEAVRGEGAVLIDDDGRRFAFDEHPDGELAPRDVVARSIARRMASQGGRPVHLDATALGRDLLEERFPTVSAAMRERGIDWARDPVPVAPAAHYLMGGVATDVDGRTTLPGLYAVGECARTGVHGANRLASNSLLEGAVFGARAAAAIASGVRGASRTAARGGRTGAAAAGSGPATRIGGTSASAGPRFSRQALQRLMWEHVGLVRDDAGLAHAASVIAGWLSRAPAPRSVRAHEDVSLLTVAHETTRAALARTTSVGAHFRADARPLRAAAAELAAAGTR